MACMGARAGDHTQNLHAVTTYAYHWHSDRPTLSSSKALSTGILDAARLSVILLLQNKKMNT